MKKIFFAGAALLAVFEVANVWLIMPLPGSQRIRSIDAAYFLYSWRWAFRGALGAVMVAGLPAVWRARRWGPAVTCVTIALVGVVAYATNFKMAADQIFLAPRTVVMAPAANNRVELKRLIVGVEVNGDARAYPVQFIGYHHQVRDSAGGRPILVSYCTVCRTGRVFVPLVDGKLETFRLVGMDHFNAMFEDASTGSWWRQANGEAITGPMKGKALLELPSQQMTLSEWLALHPATLIMQADPSMVEKYGSSYDFESGASRSSLTGTDTVSWHEKAWVVGLVVNGAARAYDWNRLRHDRVVNDTLGGRPVAIALANDDASFFAFERPDSARFTMRGDSLVAGARAWALSGRGAPGTLKSLQASQEFWHSWRTFHPATTTYQ